MSWSRFGARSVRRRVVVKEDASLFYDQLTCKPVDFMLDDELPALVGVEIYDVDLSWPDVDVGRVVKGFERHSMLTYEADVMDSRWDTLVDRQSAWEDAEIVYAVDQRIRGGTSKSV